MTREEAIDCINAIHVQMFNSGNSKWTEACDMAIEALKDRPYGDWDWKGEAKKREMITRRCTSCGVRGAVGHFCMWCGADTRKSGEET